jgi:phosphoribosylanthranilate isomerase
VQIDWDRAAGVAKHHKVVLAGGLTASNVEQAIRTVRPFGVDVSSGVEASPGIKDFEKMSAFLMNARRAFEALSAGTL